MILVEAKMDKPIINLDKGTTCTAWNYSGQRLAAGSTDGNLSIFDSTDPASSVFSCSSKFKVHESSIVKIIWAPPEYGDAVACICADGSLLLWEEVVEEPYNEYLFLRFRAASVEAVQML